MSCLFDSLSYFLKIDSFTVRQKICDYLEQNKPIIDGLDTKFVLDLDGDNYVSAMRNTTRWGGANEILAACNIWKLQINVVMYNQKNVLEFLPLDECFVKIANIVWYGNHYEPIPEQYVKKDLNK
jgi:hypothetical protein